MHIAVVASQRKNSLFLSISAIVDCARCVKVRRKNMPFDSLPNESRFDVGIAAKWTGQRCQVRQILAALLMLLVHYTLDCAWMRDGDCPHMADRNAVVKSPM
jgi:hypothetical protein